MMNTLTIVVLLIFPSAINAGSCSIHRDQHFHYTPLLPQHAFWSIPPGTLIANLSTDARSMSAVRLNNESHVVVDDRREPQLFNESISANAIVNLGSRLIVNTTIANDEGNYIFCVVYVDECEQCQLVQAKWLLDWTLHDFSVISQRRGTTSIELRYSLVWNVGLPLFIETDVYNAERRAENGATATSDDSSSAPLQPGSLHNSTLTPVHDIYTTVNITGLNESSLYIVRATVRINVTGNYTASMINDTAPIIHLPDWTRKRFYTATLAKHHRQSSHNRHKQSGAGLPIISNSSIPSDMLATSCADNRIVNWMMIILIVPRLFYARDN